MTRPLYEKVMDAAAAVGRYGGTPGTLRISEDVAEELGRELEAGRPIVDGDTLAGMTVEVYPDVRSGSIVVFGSDSHL